MFVELLAVAILIVGYLYYKNTKKSNRYYDERNIKYPGPLFGIKSLYSTVFGKLDANETAQNVYSLYPNESIYALSGSTHRQYFVRDLEAIKKITTKNFDHFEDHMATVTEEMDQILGKMLFAMRGEKWRNMRATLSPAFTGSRMRQMFELVTECTEEIVEHFSNEAKNGEKLNVEMKDFFSRYANDVIATCAFGIKVNSFSDRENEFLVSGQKLMDFNGLAKILKTLIIIMLPKVANFFKLHVVDIKTRDSFKNMILNAMQVRQDNNIYRPDMINILMEVRKGNLNHQNEEIFKENSDEFAKIEESEVGKAKDTYKWSDDELVAQTFLFFLAGFDTSSTVLMFIAYELVANPDVQQKLYEEIAEVNKEIGGERVTYELLQQMKYLDQVISETMRKWPAVNETDRLCVKDYIYDDGDKKFKIEKGTQIIFPIYGFHHDPKYYPNPERFDPERFSDENKHNIVAGTYLPFGIGPRKCIGFRFALMEIKTILYYLLLNFSLEPNKDTQIPLKLKKLSVVTAEKGIHLELKPRTK